jgi:photosynthetic reaction center L subunit
VTCFFTTGLLLAMHGGEILGAANPGFDEPVKYGEPESNYFRDTIGYSIGELGIHRLGYLLAINASVWSGVCMLMAGPFWTRGWPYWFDWYLNIPIWNATGMQ